MERKRYVLPIEVIVQMMEEAFSQGASYDLMVTGYSMSPTLQPNRDQVRLVSVRQHHPVPRDIAFCRRQNGDYVLHRILRMHPDGGCILNGDGQEWTEEIYPGDVLGVVEAIQRRGKWFPCSNPVYRLYVRLWGLTRPFRAILVKLKKTILRIGK